MAKSCAMPAPAAHAATIVATSVMRSGPELPAKRGRCTEELIATSGALTVVTNCVMAWNTQRLQRAVDRERHRVAPRYAVDALRSIGPVGHRHINFRGTYRFPVERSATRLAASAA